jgi:hypothetical protein
MRKTLEQLPSLDAPNGAFDDINDFESKRVPRLRRSMRSSQIRHIVWIGVALAEATHS